MTLFLSLDDWGSLLHCTGQQQHVQKWAEAGDSSVPWHLNMAHTMPSVSSSDFGAIRDLNINVDFTEPWPFFGACQVHCNEKLDHSFIPPLSREQGFCSRSLWGG